VPLVGLQNHLSEGPEIVLKVFQLEDEIRRVISKLYFQADINCLQDTKDSVAQGIKSRIEEKSSEISTKTSFIRPELLSLSDEKLKEYRKYEGL
jgi:oligoendopeptidase F